MSEAIHRPAPGTKLSFRFRKWDGSPHWVHECVYLGRDEHGDWFGQLPGWRSARPGREQRLRAASVSMLPLGRGDFVLTVNAPPQRTRVYIDLCWAAGWSAAGEPQAIDMDLDVVRAVDGRGVFVDDRDEWDEHRLAFDYPAEVVAALEPLAEDLEDRVRRRAVPFDDATAAGWFDVLSVLAAEEDLVDEGSMW